MAGSPGAGLLVALFLLSLPSPSLSSLDRARPAVESQKVFDYFVLALQWPATFCQRTRHCCPSNGCCRSSVPLGEFTIHGLWPNFNDGSWPACCSKSYFDIKKITSLIGKLDKYWPSLSCGSSSLCHGGKGVFWAHETLLPAEKHGTCSSPVIKDEYSYFSTTLDLYFKYNITKVLNGAGFLANNSEKYQVADIIAAVKNSTGASPLLVCSHDAIQELRLCFNKDFKPRDCMIGSNVLDNLLISRSSCPKYVSLPEHTPLEPRNESATVVWLPDGVNFQRISQE